MKYDVNTAFPKIPRVRARSEEEKYFQGRPHKANPWGGAETALRETSRPTHFQSLDLDPGRLSEPQG